MSPACDTTTFAIVPPASLPDGLPAKPSTTYACERSQVPGEPLRYTTGATRSGWAIYQTGYMLEKLNLPALAFLTVDGAENPLPAEGGQHGYTIIDSDRQPEVIAQFHAFFAQLKAEHMGRRRPERRLPVYLLAQYSGGNRECPRSRPVGSA